MFLQLNAIVKTMSVMFAQLNSIVKNQMNVMFFLQLGAIAKPNERNVCTIEFICLFTIDFNL